MPQPTQGRCEKCGQTRPLFPLVYTINGHPDTAHLCAGCHARGRAMSGERLEEELFYAIGH